MNAIIVEDDRVVGQFIQCVLEDEGMQSTLHVTGESVSFPVAAKLAIVDLVLPGISGLSIADRIKETSPGVVIVFVTGTTDPHNVRLMLGYTNYIIAKPFTESRVDDLRRVVQAIRSERQ